MNCLSPRRVDSRDVFGARFVRVVVGLCASMMLLSSPCEAQTITAKLWGAAGGPNRCCNGTLNCGATGVGGGYVNVAVNGLAPGTTLYVYVGQGGSFNGLTSTFGGGGRAGSTGGGSGGGASYISLVPSPNQADAAMLVAVAGGGAGGAVIPIDSVGNGGGLIGAIGSQSGAGGVAATGGTQSAGGTSATGGFNGGGTAGSSGEFLQGGFGMGCSGNGGGGGYYGGGGGHGDCGSCGGGIGGGGSSFVNGANVTSIFNNDQGIGQSVHPNASADPNWADNAGNGTNGDGGHGRVVLIIDGATYAFSYTGTVQTFVVPDADDNLSIGLVAHYPFNGNANDESGNGHHGTQVNTVLTTDRNGAPNSAFHFNGVNAYVTASGVPIPTNNAFSWGIWIKSEVPNASKAIIERAQAIGNNLMSPSLWWRVEQSVGFGSHRGSTGNGVDMPPNSVPVNQWFHVVCTSRADGHRAMYMNGVLAAEYESPGYGQELELFIFGGDRLQQPWTFFQGSLDDIRIYDRELSAAEAAQLHQFQGPDADGDGVVDVLDNCPAIANPSQADCDSDGVGDACEFVSGGSPYPGAVEWPVNTGGNGHWYLLNTTLLNWEDARAFAQSIGGHLATINTAPEGALATSMYVGDKWLGGLQSASACEPGCGWGWITGELMEYTNWPATEPNNGNGNGSNENRMTTFGSGQWNDAEGVWLLRSLVEWESGAAGPQDSDNDGVPDACDNCPAIANPTQADCDADGIGDACDLVRTYTVWGGGEGQIAPPAVSLVKIDAGDLHYVGLDEEGDLHRWGGLSNWTWFPPSTTTGPFIDVSSEGVQIVALRNDGSLVVWSDRPELLNAPATNDFVEVAAGATHAAARRVNGSLVGWGATTSPWNGDNPSAIPSGGAFADLACGSFNIYAIRLDGTLAVAGYGGDGQLNGVPTGNDFVKVVGGWGHGLALRSNGEVRGWGRNIHGERNIPAGVYQDIDAGDKSSIGLLTNGSVLVWGACSGGSCTVPPLVGVTAVTIRWQSAGALQVLEEADSDNDGVPDACDNCISVSNSTQTNSDTDTFGDACDNCVAISNSTQLNSDSDAFGNACDNCISVSNSTQANSDTDTFGDACDNCVAISNSTQVNSDTDALGDACDNCDTVANNNQIDCDASFVGDACEIASGALIDANGNGLVDCCEPGNECSSVAIEWPVSSGGNGHWYRLVTGPCRTWIAARDSALADHGYLATISSAAEGLRMRTLGSNLAWIGLYQDRGASDYAEPAGGWRWVSGEPLGYTNWRTVSNEPSNTLGIEDFAHIDLNAGTWNDTRGDDCMSFFIEYDADCSGDGIVDYGQIVSGQLADANGDGQPDCCASQIGCDGEYDVPSEFATVQLAIDAAPMTGGTIVKLAAGTYTAGFSLNGKDLIVRGDGPATTIIDGATATGSVVTFPGGEPATAGIEGLTIRNGLVGSPANPPFGMTLVGGGLRTFNSNAFVRNCIIENCRAGFGAGIYAYGGSILIDGCVFRWNQSQADGGGVMVFRCDTLVRSSLFLSNLCGAFGPGDGSAFKAVGGRVVGGLTTMQDCEVRQNSATTNGAAIVWFEDVFGIPGVFNLTDCIVSENSSPAGAGGLSVVAGASVSNCVLLDSILCDNTQSNVSGLVTIAGTTEICDCLPDLYADGVINAADLSILLTQWGGGANSSGDLDHDGVVSAPDLAILLDAWGACP